MPGEFVHEPPLTGAFMDPGWGSDLIAQTLRELDIPFVADVPGSTSRGLHDSIVNHLGNRAPQLILAIHEESAVAIAHGYAKVTGRMMAAALHANVGLLRAPMAVYNAWCDRVPLLVLGATGPLDATQRRPIDWIHTSTDQGAVVRDFTKWDDQPGSAAAAVEALVRAAQIARTPPRGPVSLTFDVTVQEQRVVDVQLPDVTRHATPAPVVPAADVITEVATLLTGADNPVILLGRCSRDLDDWNARVALAERLQAPVLTSMRQGAAFPTDHPLHPIPPLGDRTTKAARNLLARADVVCAFDWPGLADTLREAYGSDRVRAKVVQVSCDAHSHRGWNADHGPLSVADVYVVCEPDPTIHALLSSVGPRDTGSLPRRAFRDGMTPTELPARWYARLAAALTATTEGVDVCYTRFPLSWEGCHARFAHPLDYIGADGGNGIGSGPGITVGAALALHGTGRLPIAVLGDGDFLMGNTAIWTAAHYGLGCLFVVCNNRSFASEATHQKRIARERGRAADNEWIGTRIDKPAVDLARMAEALGAVGLGPVTEADDVDGVIADGVAAARSGKVCVIDVLVDHGRSESDVEIDAGGLRASRPLWPRLAGRRGVQR